MLGAAGAAELAAGLVVHLVGHPEPDAPELRDLHVDSHPVVKAAGPEVAALHADHRGDHAPGLQAREARADLIQVGHPGLLHPADIVGVVDDGHFVGFVIMDSVDVFHSFLLL